MHYYSIGAITFNDGDIYLEGDDRISGIFMMGISGVGNDDSRVLLIYDWDIGYDNGTYSLNLERGSLIKNYWFNYVAIYRDVC